MNIGHQLEKNSAFIGESIMLLIIIGSSIVVWTYVDVTTHDIYALPWGAMCYEGNKNPDCKHIQDITNCPNGGDACIEAKYAQMLSVEAFYLAGLMMFLKIAIAMLLKRKINATRIVQAIIWGLAPLVLLETGWEDFLYYTSRNLTVPDTLPWMNNAGLFQSVDKTLLHTTQATAMSLYIVMAIGFIMVMTMLYVNYKVTKRAGYASPI